MCGVLAVAVHAAIAVCEMLWRGSEGRVAQLAPRCSGLSLRVRVAAAAALVCWSPAGTAGEKQ